MYNVNNDPLATDSATREPKYTLNGSEIKKFFSHFLQKYVSKRAINQLDEDREYASLTDALEHMEEYESKPHVIGVLIAYANRGLDNYLVNSDTFVELHEEEVMFLCESISKHVAKQGKEDLKEVQIGEEIQIKECKTGAELTLKEYLVNFIIKSGLADSAVRNEVLYILKNKNNFTNTLAIQNLAPEEFKLKTPFKQTMGKEILSKALERSVKLLNERGLVFEELNNEFELTDTHSTAMHLHYKVTDKKARFNIKSEELNSHCNDYSKDYFYNPSICLGGLLLLPSILIANEYLQLDIKESDIVDFVMEKALLSIYNEPQLIGKDILIITILAQLLQKQMYIDENSLIYFKACYKWKTFGLNEIKYV